MIKNHLPNGLGGMNPSGFLFPDIQSLTPNQEIALSVICLGVFILFTNQFNYD